MKTTLGCVRLHKNSNTNIVTAIFKIVKFAVANEINIIVLQENICVCDRSILDFCIHMCHVHNIHMCIGMTEIDADNKYNSAYYIDNHGSVTTYRKMFLTDVDTHQGFTAGNSPVVLDAYGNKIGLIICWDGYYPEMPRMLARAGADVFLWLGGCYSKIIAQARAIENQAYIVCATKYTACDLESCNSDRTPLSIIDCQGNIFSDYKTIEGICDIAYTTIDTSQSVILPYGVGDHKSRLSSFLKTSSA